MRPHARLVAAAVVTIAVPFVGPAACRAAEPAKELLQPVPAHPTAPKQTNRLAKEKSPYLLQHAHNPVDWYPWGQEAFDRAKKENKPIFLSVGYSTCHWCHVMEREAFSDAEVAKLINENFVPVKVDREERPDVDRVYMKYVQAATGSGGWPMTVILTPDLKPFFGGTYFPVEDKFGRPGIKNVLTQVSEAWRNDRDRILQGADKVAEALQTLTAVSREGDEAAAVEKELLAAAYRQYAGQFDAEHGGFGAAPKFPEPPMLGFLLHYHHRAGEPEARAMVLKTLRAMALGGIRDQLGGGFHRYSTDPRWFLPHFEKMLYDQAQLAGVYLDAYLVSGDAFYADIARDTLDYVLREMTGPRGQFYSAEDADSAESAAEPEKKAEGAFYVWTAGEVEKLLGAEAAKVFNLRYGVLPKGNVETDPHGEFPGKNVLAVRLPIADVAAKSGKSSEEVEKLLSDARRTLFQVREARPRPYRDDKAITAWNALMISALARAGVALDEPRYTEAAVRAAGFLRDHLYDAQKRRLGRIWRDGPAGGDGFLDDYAYTVQSLLDLYETTLDVQWLRLAIDLQGAQDELFEDQEAGGYFKNSAADKSVILRLKDDHDGVEPAGNSVAALNLLRLAQMTDGEEYAKKAERVLKLYAPRLKAAPTAMPAMLVATDFHLDKPKQVVLAGDPASPDARAMLRAVHATYLPNKVVLGADGGPGQQFLAQRLDFIRDIKPLGGKPTAYVCENYACQEPTNDLGVLKRQLK